MGIIPEQQTLYCSTGGVPRGGGWRALMKQCSSWLPQTIFRLLHLSIMWFC